MADPGDLQRVIEVLRGGEDEIELIEAAARDAGDEIHKILKGHAMTMPTSRAAIGVGIHVAAQMLCEGIEFGERTVEDGEAAVTVRRAAIEYFRALVETRFPHAFDRMN